MGHMPHTPASKMNITTTSLKVIEKPFSIVKIHIHNTVKFKFSFAFIYPTLSPNGSSNSKYMFKNDIHFEKTIQITKDILKSNYLFPLQINKFSFV